MTSIHTTCAYCGVGCGIVAERTGERSVSIAGDVDHPANAGRLCSKGTHLGETVGLEGRLLHPQIAGKRVGWDSATAEVATRMRACIDEYGPDSVAFYVSGQLLTEDYYVANKLMKGFVGSGNIDTNSRLCMASAVAAHNRAFGEDVVPCSYEDLDRADLILLVGSNTAWCHPVIWQRIEAARAKRGTKLVVIDPRVTETAQQADLHIALAPDGDVALFNALLAELDKRGLVDPRYLTAHCDVPDGFFEGLKGARSGIDQAQFAALVEMVAAHPRMVTLFSQGANQSVGGTDKGNAIINLHLATGRINRPGAGPFSITGQPNAMGGREVGGLANMLACHLGFSEEERGDVAAFWQSDNLCSGPGLKAVDMFRAVHDGRIKFLWVMATNPAVSMPDAGFVREALNRCPTVVVSDIMANTDTGQYADILLPALGWGEKDGTVTNSERYISRQRAIFDAPGEARADWRIMCDVAVQMGFGEAFDFADNAAVFREYAAMTALAGKYGKQLDLTDCADCDLAVYDAMQPFQWGGTRPLAKRFSTPNGRAKLISVSVPVQESCAEYPLRLNTGRYRDQWHTMTRTGLSPTLSMHRSEPLVEIHPEDALARGISDGGLARVRTAQGDSLFRVVITDAQRPGEIFVPMHWTDQQSNGGRADRLPNQAVDPVSGQPGFKNSAAEIEAVNPLWRAFLVTRDEPELPELLYFSKQRVGGGWLIELAGDAEIESDSLLPAGERMEVSDANKGMRRMAVRDADGRLSAAMFLTHNGQLPARDWIVKQLLEAEAAGSAELLAGRPSQPGPDKGAIVCVCFDVGSKQILTAIAEQGLMSVEAVGVALNAGTNCGSCRPAIAKLLSEVEIDLMEAAE